MKVICEECGVTEVCKHGAMKVEDGVVICADCEEPNPKNFIVFIKDLDENGFRTKITGAKRLCESCYKEKNIRVWRQKLNLEKGLSKNDSETPRI